MNYSDLYKEDLSKLKIIWRRCFQMLKDAKVRNNSVMKKNECIDVKQCLWMLDKGFSWSIGTSNGKIIYNHFKLPFESLEELELKLAIRGY